MLYAVADVTRRLVGLVGGVRSRAAKAGEVPRTRVSNNASAAARAATQEGCRPVMVVPPVVISCRQVEVVLSKITVEGATLDACDACNRSRSRTMHMCSVR